MPKKRVDSACYTTYLFEPVGDHVTNPPALVIYQIPQRSQQHAMARLLLFGHDLGDGDENLHRE